MSPPRNQPARRLRRLLEQLARPVLEEFADPLPEDEPPMLELTEDGGHPGYENVICRGQLCQVRASAPDDTHGLLRIELHAGYLLGASDESAILVGILLDPGPFHLRTRIALASHGQLSVGCDLVVRPDDEPLVRRRVTELLELGRDLDWFFPLRMATRLNWSEVHQLEIPWPDLPHGDLGEFLDQALEAPPGERTPRTLLTIARGLGRWKEVLQLLREHPDELPPESCAPLKALACRELGRWMPAIRAAQEGGVRKGRYPKGPWLSPVYLHALIAAGDDIEALKLLGRRRRGEPGFYDWMRGFALHRAGDHDGARKAFDRYFDRWGGDLIGGLETQKLAEEIGE